MSGFLGRARFATILAVALALVVTGVVAGAAGQAMIVGQNNDSGASQTVLVTTAGGASFTLRNSTAGQTGQFGWSSGTTGPGRGVYGRADSADGFGMDAFNNSASSGAGAALRARGNQNVGVLATSDNASAIEAYSTTGFGVYAEGVGFAASVFGTEGADPVLAGVWGQGTAYGTVGVGTGDDSVGVYGSGGRTGVSGDTPDGGVIDLNCDPGCWDPPGGAFAGAIGGIGQTDGPGASGWSRGLLGIAEGDGIYGVVSEGDARIVGNLSVSGTCTGCTTAIIAVNGSNQTIAQGEAVTMTGVTTADDGSVVMIVAAAKAGDAVLGIADQAVGLTAAEVKLDGKTKKVPKIGKGVVNVTSDARTVKATDRKWEAKGTKAKADAYLRIVTAGMLVMDAGLDASAGDALAVGEGTGKLTKAAKDAARGSVAGKYGGKLKDGRVVVFVDPS